MIDDFEVPFDSGYGFDCYGPGMALTASYIAPGIRKHGLTTFYPSTQSIEESGARRGCVVLCKPTVHGNALGLIGLLCSEEPGRT